MSRIGKKIIEIAPGLEVKLEGRTLKAKGPKGSLELVLHEDVAVEIKDGKLEVKKVGVSKQSPAIWGLTRALINNILVGVKDGFKKQIELQGVGYRMNIQGKQIKLALGFSHPVLVDIPEGIEAKLEEANILTVSGIDKQKVGQFAHNVRQLKKAEPYKGKGFRYVGEHVRRKAGKKAATAK